MTFVREASPGGRLEREQVDNYQIACTAIRPPLRATERVGTTRDARAPVRGSRQQEWSRLLSSFKVERRLLDLLSPHGRREPG
jgi:hypothetical protein